MNPVKNNAVYFTKAELAVKAAGIHNDKPYVTFGYTLTPTNTLQVNVDASFSSCSGDIAQLRCLHLELGRWHAGHARRHAHGVAHLRHGGHQGDHPDGRGVRRQRRFEGEEHPGLRLRRSAGRRRHGLRQHRQPQHLGRDA